MQSPLKILGKTYSFKLVDVVDDEGSLGLCRDNEQEILVKLNQPKDALKDTILHEIVHAIDFQMNLGLEEHQVHCVATGIVAVLLDNPEFERLWNSLSTE